MDAFTGQNLLELSDRFKIDDDYKEYLTSIKSKNDFMFTRCNYTTYQNCKVFSKYCNHIESANTLFHKVEFGVKESFFICFEISQQVQKVYRQLIFLFVMVLLRKQLDFSYTKSENQYLPMAII